MDHQDYAQFIDIENDYKPKHQPTPLIIDQVVQKRHNIISMKRIYYDDNFYFNLENGYNNKNNSNMLLEYSGNIVSRVTGSLYSFASSLISICIQKK